MTQQAWILNAGRIGALAMISICLGSLPVRGDTPSESPYKAKCASCHGADGKGETPVGKMYKLRDLGSTDVQNQGDDDLTGIISKGKNKMPGYGRSLKEDEIKALVSYVRAFAKK